MKLKIIGNCLNNRLTESEPVKVRSDDYFPFEMIVENIVKLSRDYLEIVCIQLKLPITNFLDGHSLENISPAHDRIVYVILYYVIRGIV